MKRLFVLCAACGVGKSTLKDVLSDSSISDKVFCVDTDEVGINWWDYAGTDRESEYNDDCIARAVVMSGEKDLLFAACMNPIDFYSKVNIPDDITSSYFIGMTCSDDEISRRLKARPAERMCGSDEFISGQIEYNGWFRKNANKFQFYIDNTDMTVNEAACVITEFINSL
ncbi:MAG: AAA family ATPase [Oscillospiraceae bacterium]|nr:AAA family ATPase [Oscillospiraceae bacterium]